MTDRLAARIETEFMVGGLIVPTVSIYEANERVSAIINDFRLLEARPFDDPEEIRRIAGDVFDVPTTFEQSGTLHPAVFFQTSDWRRKPEGMDLGYFRNHDGHLIEVHPGWAMPGLVFWTGNRGAAVLHDRQRDNYFNFLVEVHKAYLKKAGVDIGGKSFPYI